MDTFEELIQEVQDDLTVGEDSALFNPDLIKRAINRAYRKCAALFPWPELMDAKKTSTQANQEYYDYPRNWRSLSIWKLTIQDSNGNDIRYGETPDGSPLSFDDYLAWKQDNPTATDKKWANQWRRFFIWPVPTVAGTNNISVWGIMNPEKLEDNEDITIFSYSAPECNEAVVLEAVAILKSKASQEQQGQFRSVEAKEILSIYWNKLRKEQAKYEKNMPFFEVPDFFGTTNSKDLRGRFDT